MQLFPSVSGQNASFRQSSAVLLIQQLAPHLSSKCSTSHFSHFSLPQMLSLSKLLRMIRSRSRLKLQFSTLERMNSFFASSVTPPESSMIHSNRISKINISEAEEALASGMRDINIPFTTLELPGTVQITNGGTGPFKGNLLLATRGRGPLPSSIVLVNPKPPFSATVLLDNFFGRQFKRYQSPSERKNLLHR
ncbi:hypothetical protein BDQ17DRAFT_551895 [Cyathus striatus]|nr:hypothetical protein BDQ17DRAFT_551895 [Cyathus striatus]